MIFLSSKFSSSLEELSTFLRGGTHSSLRCPPTELPCNLAVSTMRSLLSCFETFASFLLRAYSMTEPHEDTIFYVDDDIVFYVDDDTIILRFLPVHFRIFTA